MPRRPSTTMIAASFGRPSEGVRFPNSGESELPLSGLPAWQSNGGPTRGHPSRSLPFTLEVPLAEVPGALCRIHIVGVFADTSGPDCESVGTLGASLQIVGERDALFRVDLHNGRHYRDATDLRPLALLNGDGTSLSSLGTCTPKDETLRVDILTLDVPAGVEGSLLRFKDLGSPASFLIFDIFLETNPALGCPFHSKSGGIGLAEVPALVRVGDRVRFARAVDQLEKSIQAAEDLDEARGQALMFLALVTSALLEMGGSRSMHRLQLDAARAMERVSSREELAIQIRQIVDDAVSQTFKPVPSPSAHLVDRALQIVERNFARDINDSIVAEDLGLSTSHFRHLFRETTGQPFHKYLVSLRLEKARKLLIEQDLPVSEVARAVGFAGLSHFSRAFNHRFSVSPTHFRRGV